MKLLMSGRVKVVRADKAVLNARVKLAKRLMTMERPAQVEDVGFSSSSLFKSPSLTTKMIQYHLRRPPHMDLGEDDTIIPSTSFSTEVDILLSKICPKDGPVTQLHHS